MIAAQSLKDGRLLSAKILDVVAIAAVPVAVIICFVIASATTDDGPHAVAPVQDRLSNAAAPVQAPAHPAKYPWEK